LTDINFLVEKPVHHPRRVSHLCSKRPVSGLIGDTLPAARLPYLQS
jgi:hypothetical protein